MSESESVSLTEKGTSKKESEPEKKTHKNSQHFTAFLAELESIETNEDKLKRTIEFMEASLAQKGSPHFKSFWEARSICLDLFKQNISGPVRTVLWAKYTELSQEVRNLKKILDEQSSFAAEQIEIAIQALEKDLEARDQHLKKQPIVEIPGQSRALQEHSVFYSSTQRELDLLNAQAARINALRKELIKTEMRIRQKNRFFERLSNAGDLVFPRRKELIHELSKTFMADVDTFVAMNFGNSKVEGRLHLLREEIKTLQTAAKILTLNTHAFSETRLKLGECWDKLKASERERKKEYIEKKEVFQENAEAVRKKILEFADAFGSGSLALKDARKQLDAIAAFMRSQELGRDEVKVLREELSNAKKPFLDKIEEEEEAQKKKEQELKEQRTQHLNEFRNRIEKLVAEAQTLEIKPLEETYRTLSQELQKESFTKAEKFTLERLLKGVRDAVDEKKEQAILSLSEDDRNTLQQLKDVLEQRKKRRQEIKTQIEELRKVSGGSTLDFEQLMEVSEQTKVEKERLEKVDQGIKEIEDKIASVERKT